MKIRSFFLLCMAAVAVISLALAGVIAQVAWQRLQDKDAGLDAIEVFAVILKASEVLTLERAPSNGLLNAEQGDAAATKRLADARAALDAVLKDLATRSDRQGREQVAALERGIVASRQLTDREAAKPKAQREAAALAAASRQQLALAELLAPIVRRGLQTVARIDPELSSLAALASTAADARETGGRKASTVAAPMLANRAFSPQEVIASDELEGRLQQLQSDLEQLVGRVEPDDGIIKAWANARTTYFENGARLVAQTLHAGRSGSAFTAQIGSMKLREEIDAMRTIGLDPVEVLVLPRLLALMIALPLLTFFADIMGLLGGGLMAWISLDLPPRMFLTQLQQAIALNTFFVGLIKAPVFAVTIAIVGSYMGMKVSGSAESVGQMTTASVVLSIFLVIVLDAIFSIFFSMVGL